MSASLSQLRSAVPSALPCHRNLIAKNRMFEVDNLNDWQHSSMYLGERRGGR